MSKVKVICLIIVAIVLALFINKATGECLNSPTIESYYSVDSEAFRKGKIMKVPEIFDAMMLDIEEDSITVSKSGVIDGEFYFPVIPDDLQFVFLFDGFNFVSGSFEITSPTSVHAWFWITDICSFSRIDNIYLLLIR